MFCRSLGIFVLGVSSSLIAAAESMLGMMMPMMGVEETKAPLLPHGAVLQDIFKLPNQSKQQNLLKLR